MQNTLFSPVSRRCVLTGGAAVLLLGDGDPLPVPPSNRLLFEVVRHGGVMGTHRLDFVRSQQGLVVTVNVQMALSFGPFRLFHYAHHAVERWQSNQCVSLEAQTDHNGAPFRVVAVRDAGGWSVQGSKGNLRAPPNTLPATHWNRAMLSGPMINTETGSVMRPKIADLGQDHVPNSQNMAEHFVMTGDAQMDTWYDAVPSWAGARFVGGDGSQIEYQRAG